MGWQRQAVVLSVVASAACAPTTEPATGSFSKTPLAAWPEGALRPQSVASGLTAVSGEIVVVEGSAELVSGIDDAFGLRIDEDRNDLAAVVAAVTDAIDEQAVVVLFTQFDDRGAGGPAYYFPLFDDTAGIRSGAIDQRDEFGTRAFLGVVNMKRFDSHAPSERVDLFAHELAHRHVAYLPPVVPETATVAFNLLGRQQSHWHALLHTDGSFLGGHGFRELGPGRFIVTERDVRLADLDLYGLGLLPSSSVAATFFISEGRTVGGAAIPEAAMLEPGTEVLGTRVDFDIDDVITAAGPRIPGFLATEKTTRCVFVFVTTPGQTATSTAVTAEIARIDAFRESASAEWSAATRGVGTLCTALAGCSGENDRDAGIGPEAMEGEGCSCAGHERAARRSSIWGLFLLLLPLKRMVGARHERRPPTKKQ